MKGIEYDTSQKGFNTVLKDWQLKATQVVWSSPNGVNSRTVHQKANQALQGETISRASVINFLEDLREMGVLSGEERAGKGGHHWFYFPKLDEVGFKRFIAETLLEKLKSEFPGETSIVIKTLNL